jgi:hypothetical protein
MQFHEIAVQGLNPGVGIKGVFKNNLGNFFKKEVHINKRIIRYGDLDVVMAAIGQIQNSSGFHGNMPVIKGVFRTAGEDIDKAVAAAVMGGIAPGRKIVFCYIENGRNVPNRG